MLPWPRAEAGLGPDPQVCAVSRIVLLYSESILPTLKVRAAQRRAAAEAPIGGTMR